LCTSTSSSSLLHCIIIVVVQLHVVDETTISIHCPFAGHFNGGSPALILFFISYHLEIGEEKNKIRVVCKFCRIILERTACFVVSFLKRLTQEELPKIAENKLKVPKQGRDVRCFINLNPDNRFSSV
jgi:hypothetical protein